MQALKELGSLIFSLSPADPYIFHWPIEESWSTGNHITFRSARYFEFIKRGHTSNDASNTISAGVLRLKFVIVRTSLLQLNCSSWSPDRLSFYPCGFCCALGYFPIRFHPHFRTQNHIIQSNLSASILRGVYYHFTNQFFSRASCVDLGAYIRPLCKITNELNAMDVNFWIKGLGEFNFCSPPITSAFPLRIVMAFYTRKRFIQSPKKGIRSPYTGTFYKVPN